MGWIAEEYPETLPAHVRQHLGIEAGPRHFDTVVMGRATYDPAVLPDAREISWDLPEGARALGSGATTVVTVVLPAAAAQAHLA